MQNLSRIYDKLTFEDLGDQRRSVERWDTLRSGYRESGRWVRGIDPAVLGPRPLISDSIFDKVYRYTRSVLIYFNVISLVVSEPYIRRGNVVDNYGRRSSEV